jgi:hypothetical protein
MFGPRAHRFIQSGLAPLLEINQLSHDGPLLLMECIQAHKAKKDAMGIALSIFADIIIAIDDLSVNSKV